MAQITSSGHSPSTLSKLPAIRTFQMDGSGVSSIPNSVNLFRGDVNLPLELISLPGRGDLDVKVAIMYQSNIQNLVDTWNLEAPTGILGLGWNMPHEMIVIDNKNTGSSYDNEYYLVSGGGGNRLHQDGVTKDGAWNFETEDHKPWKINYYPKSEEWVIVKENGVKQIYGGKDNHNHIHWGVKWGGRDGNWIDSSINTSGQKKFAEAWNLREICNTWGEKVTFDYEVELESIGDGGKKYTRACYLKQITALDGRTVNFVYKDKQYDERVKEYEIPHQYTRQPDIHAYQDRYETKFLDSIEVRAESDSLLFSVKFDYELKNVSLNDDDVDFSKRYLIGITQKNDAGESLPGYRFQYYTEKQDIRENIHRGALKTITYPAGAIATFTYEKQNLAGTSHKTTIYGKGIPRVWFGGDYVVVAYYDHSQGNLDVRVYSWNGNWISYEQSISGKLDIDSLQVATQRDFFALSFKANSEMRVYLFHQEMGRFGKWRYEHKDLSLASRDAQTHLAVGSDFVVACASGSPQLGLYVWNQQSKLWDERSQGISINKGNYAVAAFGNYFTIGVYDTATKRCELILYYQDKIRKLWYSRDIGTISTVEQDPKGNPYLNWSLNNHSATATFIKKLGGSNIDYEVQVYQWNADFDIQQPLSHSYSISQKDVDLKEPFNYAITTGSLVANLYHLWRYNGSKWVESNLEVGKEVSKFAYGSDLAIASSSYSTIKAYNAHEDRWGFPYINDDWSRDEYHPTVSGDFITMGNAIFYRDNQGRLNKVGSLPSGIKPDSIINRAPYYIACENNDGGVQVRFLKNGKVVKTNGDVVKTELLESRIYVDDQNSKGKSGTQLAGFNAFVTYDGNDFSQASRLNLYYVAHESIKDEFVDLPVVKVTIDDGYHKSYTSYGYDKSKIVVDHQGRTTHYSHVTVAQGSENVKETPFGKTEYFFFNGLAAKELDFRDFQGNIPYYYSLLHGSLHHKRDYNAAGEEVSRQTVEYEIVTKRKELGKSENINLYGFYIEHKRESNIIYGQEFGSSNSKVGVKREVEYEYDLATRLLKKQTSYNYNSSGEKETLTQTSVYGWEKYEALRQKNILTPVVQTTNKTDAKTTAISVSTWKDWGNDKWGLFKSYQAKQENAVFKEWDNSTEPNKADWLKVSEVVSRTDKGVVNGSVDGEGIHSSTILDKQEFYPVAKFTNARINEATYLGFEAYESLDNWAVNQGKLSDYILSGDAHTGVSSFRLQPQLVLTRKLLIPDSHQKYILSAWFKTDEYFELDDGKVKVELHFYDDSQSLCHSIDSEIAGIDGKWQYWYYIIDYSQVEWSQLEIRICNRKGNKSLLLDNICFAPLLGSLEANVYEPKYKNITAQLTNHGDTLRYLYDSFQRKVADIGIAETVNAVTTSYLARQREDNTTSAFPQTEPNSVLDISAAGGGVYANFTNGEQWHKDWTTAQRNNWQVKNNALVHRGTTYSSITYQPTASLNNYGVRLSVYPSGELQHPLGIRIGSNLTITWKPNQGWYLEINGKSNSVEHTGSVPHEWLLVAANNTVLFYADGQQICAQTIADRIIGALELFTGDEVTFKNIVTFQDPQIGVTYSDGAGKERQVQALEETNCLVSEKVYDSLNRAVIETKTARFANTLFGYRSEFVHIDWKSGVLTGEVADYYPDDEGYPYNRTVLEASPLHRPIQQGIPGKEFAITEDNSHIVTHEYGTNQQGFFAEDGYPTGQYLVEQVTDANGTLVYTLKDTLGQTLAQKAGPIESGSDVYQTTRSIYDEAGNVVKVLLPNHFSPPEGSQPQAWEITMKYDFLGQMTSQTHPDSGTVKSIYDIAGRPRFMVDAVGSKSGTILYKKYDLIGRLIEEGYFSGDWTALQEKADTEPNYPQSGHWRKKYIFDGDGSNPHLIGHLWKVLSHNQGEGKEDVEEVYEYDQFGNVVSKTLRVEGYEAQVVNYEYDNLGNVTKVSYPQNSHIPEVVYSYNNLGETIAVGTPANPQQFATYSYNADGSLARTNLNQVKRELQYNSPGLPTEITNQKADNSLLMEQSLAYTRDGYEGSGYFNGNIAKNSINYGDGENASRNHDYKYQYDNLGQLQVAQNSRDPEASLGVGQPTTYDLNGNIETLKRGNASNQYKYVPKTNKVDHVTDSSERQSYTYDANGNVTAAAHRHISHIDYDPLTQLTTKVKLEGEKSVSFKYDGGNQRVLKTARDSSGRQTTAKLYVHGLNDYPLLEKSEETVQYIYGIDGLLALVKDGKVYTVLKDHLGSTRVVVNEAGTVIAAFDYLPFGDLQGTAYGNPEIISYRYTGQEFDPELGLYNYRARFYDPRLGRFYAMDPAGQFASPYLYGGNNPITYIDPTGQVAWKKIGSIGLDVCLIGIGIGITFYSGGALPLAIAGTFIGAGFTGLGYSVSHSNDEFKWKDYALALAGGAAEGAIIGLGGAIGASVSSALLGLTAESVFGGVGAEANQLISHYSNGSSQSDLVSTFLYGAFGTFAGAALLKVLHIPFKFQIKKLLEKQSPIKLTWGQSIMYRGAAGLIGAVAGVGVSLGIEGVRYGTYKTLGGEFEFNGQGLLISAMAGGLSGLGHISKSRFKKEIVDNIATDVAASRAKKQQELMNFKKRNNKNIVYSKFRKYQRRNAFSQQN